jgi:hypothetical protein
MLVIMEKSMGLLVETCHIFDDYSISFHILEDTEKNA